MIFGKKPGGISCRQVAKDLQTFLDEETDDESRRHRIAEHLEACRDCGLEADTYRAIKGALAQRAPEIDPATMERLRAFSADLSDDTP